MSLFLPDTSVIVPSLFAEHPLHDRANGWFERVSQSGNRYCIADRSVAETYAVLTTLPRPSVPNPHETMEMIDAVLRGAKHVIALSAAETVATTRWLVERGMRGRVIYDALIAKAAVKAKVDFLVTFDVTDFRRVWPLDPNMIREP